MLFVISAPSGTGKTTICKHLVQRHKKLRYCVSYTTRSPRRGERDGKNYYFIKEEEFEELIKEGMFVEWTHIYGNYYGTGRRELSRLLREGEDVLLDLDVNGALKIKEEYDAVLIFLLPPTPAELYKRLKSRRTEDTSIIAKRLAGAKEQMKLAEKFDYCVVNECLRKTVETILSIMLAEKNKIGRQGERLKAFRNGLSAIG